MRTSRPCDLLAAPGASKGSLAIHLKDVAQAPATPAVPEPGPLHYGGVLGGHDTVPQKLGHPVLYLRYEGTGVDPGIFHVAAYVRHRPGLTGMVPGHHAYGVCRGLGPYLLYGVVFAVHHALISEHGELDEMRDLVLQIAGLVLVYGDLVSGGRLPGLAIAYSVIIASVPPRRLERPARSVILTPNDAEILRAYSASHRAYGWGLYLTSAPALRYSSTSISRIFIACSWRFGISNTLQ